MKVKVISKSTGRARGGTLADLMTCNKIEVADNCLIFTAYESDPSLHETVVFKAGSKPSDKGEYTDSDGRTYKGNLDPYASDLGAMNDLAALTGCKTIKFIICSENV